MISRKFNVRPQRFASKIAAAVSKAHIAIVENWFDALADVMWGSQCPVCAKPGADMCQSCWPIPAPHRLQFNDRLLQIAFAEAPIAACRYDSSFRFLISAIKEQGRHDLAPIVAELSSVAFSQLTEIPTGTVLVPIPSRWLVSQKRGISLPQELAAALPGNQMNLLRYAHSVRDQAGLSAWERKRNMSGAFIAKHGSPKNVIVVDDVCTTGATLRAAVVALLKSGHKVHSAVFASSTRV